MLNISNNDVKIPENTVLGSINPIINVDAIQEVSWQKIQDAKEEAVKNTAQDQQVHKLLPACCLKILIFRFTQMIVVEPAVMLQDTEIPQAARDKLIHMIDNQFHMYNIQLISRFW